jgi:queuine tRNA-ribosyltransferase
MDAPGFVATAHGDLRLPAFLPDATRAVVRSVDAADLEACGVEGVVTSLFHLAQKPGSTVVSALGGLHTFMNWRRPIMTDSGGFQVYSLSTDPTAQCSVSARGFAYRPAGGAERELLTPEKSVQRQFKMGADILVCLDHCTHPDAPSDEQRQSVEHTVRWAAAGRREFDRLLEQNSRAAAGDRRPLLFAVIQGGNDPELRRECAQRLLEIGFDGYGFGGWPIGSDGRLTDMVEHVAGLVPPGTLLHGLGIGKPGNLVRAYRAGYRMFDCALPTRDARHKRLYVFSGGAAVPRDDSFYDCLYLEDERHRRSRAPIEAGCDCPTCRGYTLGYLHHLFAIGDSLAWRLATMHNLRFYARLIGRLRESE